MVFRLFFLTFALIICFSANSVDYSEIKASVSVVNYSIDQLNKIMGSSFQCSTYSLKNGNSLCKYFNYSEFMNEVFNNADEDKIIQNFKENIITDLKCDLSNYEKLKEPYKTLTNVIYLNIDLCKKRSSKQSSYSNSNNPTPLKASQLLGFLKNKDLRYNFLIPFDKKFTLNQNIIQTRYSFIDKPFIMSTKIPAKDVFKLHKIFQKMNNLRSSIILEDSILLSNRMNILFQTSIMSNGNAVFRNKNLKNDLIKQFKALYNVEKLTSNQKKTISDQLDINFALAKIGAFELIQSKRPLDEKIIDKLKVDLNKVGLDTNLQEIFFNLIEKTNRFDSVNKSIEKALDKNKKKYMQYQAELSELITNNETAIDEFNQFEINYNKNKSNEIICKNLPRVCQQQLISMINEFGGLIYTSNELSSVNTQKRANKLVDTSIDIFKNNLNSSKLSKVSKKILNANIDNIKIAQPNLQKGDLNKYLKKIKNKQLDLLTKNKDISKLGAMNNAFGLVKIKGRKLPFINDLAESSSSGRGAAYINSQDKQGRIVLGTHFSNKKIVNSHKLKLIQILQHELAHSIDPDKFNDNDMSKSSFSQLKKLKKCIKFKFPEKNKSGENFADLIANESIINTFNTKHDENVFDDNAKTQLIISNIKNACNTKNVFSDIHESFYIREQQFFSHPKFNKAFPNFAQDLDHGKDCGEILWQR